MRADIGKELNLSVVGGAGDVVRLRLLDEREERIETAGKTFYAELRSQETDERLASVGVTYSAERDVVLTLPEMAVGQYVLVVEVSASSGARERLLSGWVTYMEPGALVKPKVDFSPDRLVGVIMDGERHRCVWYHTTAAEVYADKAETEAIRATEEADRSKTEADRAKTEADRAAGVASGMQGALDDAVGLVTQRAEAAAERAEDAAADAERSASDAEAAKNEATAKRDEVFEKFEETDAFIEAFWRDASNVIVPNSATGTWYVGGRDTTMPYRGANGKSPRVTPDGYWERWEWDGDAWDGGSWVDTGTPAVGKNGFSPYINGAGYWVYIDPVSGQQVTGDLAGGRDGIDGATVRRILVDSYEDIPQTGETCNGGYYYYVSCWKDSVRGTRVRMRKPNGLFQGGEPFYIEIDGETDFRAIEFAGDSIEGFIDYLDSGGVLRGKITAENEVELWLPNDGYFRAYVLTKGLAEFKLPGEDGYDVYAWLESDGVGSWVNVGLANDLATAEVYGLMKYGTDKRVVGGAPVGRNAEGQASVPVADLSLPGAVRPTTQIDPEVDNPNEGGGTHMGDGGIMLVDKATPKKHGAMMHSYGSRIDDGPNCVGVRADGKTDVVWATLNQGGATRLGSRIGQVANRPYLLSVGAITDPNRPNDKHKLANNLMVGGAVKHGTKAEWSTWMNGHGFDFSGLTDGYYLGIHTSKSFKQSTSGGLELMPATDKLLGGVKVMETLGSGTAVPTGTAVLDYLSENYYTKEELYTKNEVPGVVDARINAVLPGSLEVALRPYATQSWTSNNFVSKSSYTGWKDLTDRIITTHENRLEVAEKAIVANKTACDNSITGLTATVSSNKTACDNSVAQLNGRIAALEGKTDGYLKMVGAFAGTVELWGGTAEEFAKVDITGKRMFMTLEN